MDLQALVNGLLPVLGQVGVDALTKEVSELTADAKEPWKKAILGLVANGVETFGPRGVQVASAALNKMLAGDDPEIEWADLDVQSDILAHMQNAEADRATAAKAFLAKVGKVLGQVFGGFIKGLIAAA
tara:strand:- start:4114 stop:4497 length:384 start_codon:yes stop_codon:yes gene_type:complete